MSWQETLGNDPDGRRCFGFAERIARSHGYELDADAAEFLGELLVGTLNVGRSSTGPDWALEAWSGYTNQIAQAQVLGGTIAIVTLAAADAKRRGREGTLDRESLLAVQASLCPFWPFCV
jgi:hypothetical protein